MDGIESNTLAGLGLAEDFECRKWRRRFSDMLESKRESGMGQSRRWKFALCSVTLHQGSKMLSADFMWTPVSGLSSTHGCHRAQQKLCVRASRNQRRSREKDEDDTIGKDMHQHRLSHRSPGWVWTDFQDSEASRLHLGFTFSWL